MSQAENRTCQFVAGETDFEFVGSRIEECISSHENCQDPDIDFWQFDTSRFVDVGERKIVLFDSSTPPDYIALSYVWGSVKQISYSLNTTLPRLPQTIEDAMIVVRKLGKRYLWVDSLCIDQMNDEHKQSQIMIMHEIYHNSWAIIV
ncbi:heterokaryon incompatibility protein-domain-containing protein, partial [Leptodontidium sp. 2 PMI_412]